MRSTDAFERTLHMALGATEVHFVLVDASRARFEIAYCNEALSKLTGYAREEVIGRSPSFLTGLR